MLRSAFGRHAPEHVAFLLRYPGYYRTLRGYLSVDGWLGYAEAVNLYKLACALPADAPRVVEIGSWQGKSSVVLGRALTSRQGGRLYCIEPFTAAGVSAAEARIASLKEAGGLSLRGAFVKNISANRLDGVVDLIADYSYNVVKNWRDSIDLLFIDGDHSYEAVRRDFVDWTPFIVRGGHVVMDDVVEANGRKLGPARVVEEFILGSNEWTDTYQVGRHFSARRA